MRPEWLSILRSDRTSTPRTLLAGPPAARALVEHVLGPRVRRHAVWWARLAGIAAPEVTVAEVADGRSIRDRILADDDIPEALREALRASTEHPPSLELDRPIATHPAFRLADPIARGAAIAEWAGVPDAAVAELVGEDVRYEQLEPATLAGLVRRQVLTRAEADAIARVVTIHRLVDERDDLTARLVTSSVDELVAMKPADWLARTADLPPPRSVSREDWARALTRKAANAWPAAAVAAAHPDWAPILNAEPGILGADLSVGSTILDGVDPATVSGLKGLQRALAISGDVTDALVLADAGYTSAASLATATPAMLSADVGLSLDRAVDVVASAQTVSRGVAGAAGVVIDLWTGGLGALVSNVTPDATGFLAELPGYDELFGVRTACACDACASVLGPAAYFVDLMSFVDDHVTSTTFVGGLAGHPLALKSRRPDLWTLTLSCDNTDTLVPSLQIVCEVLENAVAGPGADVADRPAIEARVYRELLPRALASFAQPVTEPLDEVEILLGAFDRTLDELAHLFDLGPGSLGRVSLGISALEHHTITTPSADLAFLARVYRVPFGATGTDPLDVGPFLGPMGVDRDTFVALVGTRFVAGDRPPVVKAEKASEDSLQNDVERIYGLDVGHLDRLHRFTRLQRVAGWGVLELDLALTGFAEAGIGTGIDAAVVDGIAELRRMQDLRGFTLEEAVLALGPLPVDPTEAAPSMLDRSFNLDRFVALAGALPSDRRYLHPSLGTSTAPEHGTDHARLLAGLGLDEEGLEALVLGLAGPLGVDPAGATEVDRSFPLDRDHLTLLARHAVIASRLGVTVPELLAEMATQGRAAIDGMDAALSTLARHDWLTDSAWSVEGLSFALGLPVEVAPLDDPATVATEIAAELAPSLTFDATVLVAAGLTEAQSSAVLSATPGIEPVDGQWRLGAAFDPSAPLVLPDGADGTAALELLLAHHASRLLRTSLPAVLGTTAERVDGLCAILRLDLGALHPALSGDVTPLATALAPLERLAVLFLDDAVFDADTLASLAARRDLVPLRDPSAPDLAAADAVEAYRRLRLAPSEEVDPDALARVLRAFDPTHGYRATPPDLPGVLGCTAGLAAGLAAVLPVGPDPRTALRTLVEAVAVAQDLGVGAGVLRAAVSAGVDDLADAATGLVASLRARHPETADWDAAWAPLGNQILNRKRDGLVAWLVHSGPAPFDEPADLYAHYLLDAEIDGSLRTSRLVSAISTVQLYVQRVTLGLERSPDRAPNGVTVGPETIPAEEWEWRRAYRLWEANRKVFLFPENWLLPEVRDDKTPLFRAFEQAILAGDLSDEAVTAAYAEYLRGFDQLARLRIAGACKERDDAGRHDVLHLLGATSEDPPRYYYRRVDDLEASVANADRATTWGPWEPIKVDIGARRVSPMVYRGRLRVFWVTYTTRTTNAFVDGSSEWSGYRHQMRVSFVERAADGTWSAPQVLSLVKPPFSEDLPSVVLDPLVPIGLVRSGALYDEGRTQAEALEGYTLRGVGWDRVQPFVFGSQLCLRARDLQVVGPIDLFGLTVGDNVMPTVSEYVDRRVPHVDPFAGLLMLLLGWGFPAARVVWSRPDGDGRHLAWGPPGIPLFENETWAVLLSRQENVERYEAEIPGENDVPWWDPAITDGLRAAMVDNPLADFPKDEVDILPITGSPQDVVLTYEGDPYLLLEGARADGKYHLGRLFTAVADDLGRTLFTEGLDGFLSLDAQLAANEPPVPFTVSDDVFDATGAGTLSFDGPAGVYLRELFLHGPMLVAATLAARGRHEDARRWFAVLFDPTAAEPGVGPTERVWRYREFRELDAETLRDQLTNDTAVEQYRTDPFNPHAIARLRLTAYQKAVVQQSAADLIAWGDSLFLQDTTEAVQEATLLYRMAQDVLGEPPVPVGDCGELAGDRTYGGIEGQIEADPELLLELETLQISGRTVAVGPPTTRAAGLALSRSSYRTAGMRIAPTGDLGDLGDVDDVPGWTDAVIVSLDPVATSVGGIGTLGWPAGWGFPSDVASVVSPLFCFPENDAVAALRDLAADRLFKIRHSMDIHGIVRQLALFAPPIDPGLLVRAMAAGLDLGDVLAATTGAVPAHRFRPLLERANAHAAQLQSLGGSLYAALDRQDAEELSTLRTTHQRNQLALSTRLREREVTAAEHGVAALAARQVALEAQRDFYAGLVDAGDNGWETAQLALMGTAAGLQLGAGIADQLAAVLFVTPNVGAPTAMTFGGRELGESGRNWANVARDAAALSSTAASTLGIQASFARRTEQWTFQRDAADLELDALKPQIDQANVRLEIAQRALEVHENELANTDEVLALLERRFTDQELLSWRAAELQVVYRQAWLVALAFARMAEQAYHYERDDDTVYVDGTGWDPSRAGLLAGERLIRQLAALEQRYVETSTRRQEVSLTVSLSQLDPVALLNLREQASCEFVVSELAFDLFYPGQFRRRIRSVRMTVPCVTGPFTNVSAKLSLLESWIRDVPDLDPAALVPVPVRGTTAVAMSSAQGDLGVLDLAFGSERYLPFEGAGAVSRWRVELPSRFRPFDYRTIADVLITVAYEADDDGVLRQAVEAETGALVDALTTGPLVRVLSLRQDASDVFQRLLYGPSGTEVMLTLDDRQFPLFLAGQSLVATGASIALSLAPGVAADGVVVALDGRDVEGFASDAALGGLPSASATAAFGTVVKASHRIAIRDPAGAAATGGPLAVDPDRLLDLLLVLTYRVAGG